MMNLSRPEPAGIRRASVGLRRGSRARDSDWHSASCKAPRSSYTHFVQQSEELRHQLQPVYVYETAQAAVPSPASAVSTHSEGARPGTSNGLIPHIRVTNPPRESRRTSIFSPLRFTRTVSTDSIDSLERQCLRDLRWQRMMEAEQLLDEPLDQPPPPQVKQKRRPSTLLQRQNSSQPDRPEVSSAPPSSASSNSIGCPHLRQVGRSKTDPGNEAAEEQGPSSASAGSSLRPNGLKRSPLSLSNGDACLKRSDATPLKRSSPDLVLDGVAKSRVLSEVIGLSFYQQKLITQCWPNIYSTGINGNFASQLYSSLYSRNSKAKSLMQKADGVAVFAQSDADCTTMHTKWTLELLDTIVRNLDAHPATIVAYLNDIGQSHRSLKTEGVCVAMWDDLGDAILDGVRKNEVVRKHKELRRAWLAVIAFITDNIKQGQCLFRSSPSVEVAEIRLE